MSALIDEIYAHYTLNGFSLSEMDDLGCSWYVHILEGWNSSDVRLNLASRVQQHGAYDGPAYYAEKKLTLEGTIIAPDIRTRRLAEARLEALTSSLESVILKVDEDPYYRQVSVKRAGRLSRTVGADGRRVRYSIPLVASDPRRYDQTEQAVSVGLPASGNTGITWPLTWPMNFGASNPGGSVNVTNNGDIDVHPILVISGPVTNPVIANSTTGETMTFDYVLGGGETLVIDTANRTVLLGGTASRRYALKPDSAWPRVIPGVNTFQMRGVYTETVADQYSEGYADTYGGSTPPLLTIRFRSAWA